MSNTFFSGQRPALQGKRIMVAEDETMIAMMMREALADAGALVLGPVASVRDALHLADAAAGSGRISAAVVDVKLGHEQAICVADALRERGVPFLFATGYDQHPGFKYHRDVPVLCKPYGPDDLIRVVESLCQVKGAFAA
jgi:DNA-binding response OmpR family regulator